MSDLEKQKFSRFIIKYCDLLRNRSDGQFLCNLCLKQIKKNQVPQRSHVNKFKFANFPRSFIQELKKQCTFKEQILKPVFNQDNETYERNQLKLNRLESYLLK